jgi:hypothetical protein
MSGALPLQIRAEVGVDAEPSKLAWVIDRAGLEHLLT